MKLGRVENKVFTCGRADLQNAILYWVQLDCIDFVKNDARRSVSVATSLEVHVIVNLDLRIIEVNRALFRS